MSADNKKDITIEKKDEKTEGIESRRRVLKKILIGSGAVAAAGMLPAKWMKPVINAVGPYNAHASLTTLGLTTTVAPVTTTVVPVTTTVAPVTTTVAPVTTTVAPVTTTVAPVTTTVAPRGETSKQPNVLNQVVRQDTNTVKVKVKTRLGKFRSNTFSGGGSKGAGKTDTED